MSEIADLAAETMRVLNEARYITRATDEAAAWSQIGSVVDYLERIVVLSATAPPPAPDPPAPTVYLGFAVSYSGHDPARDVYLGHTPDEKEWGRHDGYAILAPTAGKVELYQFGTPLSFPQMSDPDYTRRHEELFGQGMLCMAPPPDPKFLGSPLFGSQTMYFALFLPDTPIRLSNGQMAKALWFGHVKGDIAVGRVNAGDRICTSYDSGIRFENNGITARAAHIHLCGSASGTLSMNGDVDGLLVAQALGWQIEYRGAGGPGPDAYMSGGWIAGKPKSQWQGRTLPPVPS
jgi:hypothetical protein